MYFNKAYEDIDIQDGQYVIITEQTIGIDFWEEVKRAKEEFDLKKNDYIKVASIPTAVINKWMREGFDFNNATAQEALDKLRKDEFDKMIISGDKRF